ncbi:MAG TPA: TlpA disulfide reductase family protein, partial [Thermomicrobiales bacterium]|nr:TlpA disulfide reductase family protein [Thermomicrobiales bacterium]
CAPCKSELPRFQAISESGEPVKIVGIDLKNDYEGNARDLIADLGLTFPIGRDTAGDDPMRGAIELAFGVANYPATVFIRPDGTVAAVHIGELNEDEIRGYVERAARSESLPD